MLFCSMNGLWIAQWLFMKVLTMSALRTFFCALHGISHLAPKPTSDLHEVVVGFSEERTIALTIKFSRIAESANPIHDLLKNFIDVEQVDRLGGGELPIACDLLLGVLNVPSQPFQYDLAGIAERFFSRIFTMNGRCELLIAIQCVARSLQQRIDPSLRSNLRMNGNGKCECQQQHREQSARLHEGSP
jgi:hypothetical protein